jgi:hypothetical protein
MMKSQVFRGASRVFRLARSRSAGVVALTLLGAAALALPAFAQKPENFEYPGPRVHPESFQFGPLPSWLTWDMEIRPRMEGQTSLNEVSSNDRIYVLTRVRGGLTVRFTDFLRGYLQFQDNRALGLPLPQVAANMRDGFDLFQGYLDIHPIDKLDLVTGRQLLRYGSERVVGISDWTNNSRSWDGFDGHYGNRNWIEAFASSVVIVHPTSLDKHGPGLTFYGVVGNISTWVPHTEIMPFNFIRRVLSVDSQQGIHGGELENTFGAEVNGKIPGGFYYDVLGDLQRGAYSNDSIHSGSGYEKAGYEFRNAGWKPRFEYEYDYATGNPHRNPYRIGTFDQQYPSNHNAFGLTDIFGFQNITQKRVNINMKPADAWTLLFQGEALDVATRRDGVYNGAGGVLVKAPTRGFSANDIGQEFDASTDYVYHKYLDVQFGVGHLFPGRVLADNGKAPPQTLGYFMLTYRFTANKVAAPSQPEREPR